MEAKWNLDPDPLSVSDPDPRPGVESPFLSMSEYVTAHLVHPHRVKHGTIIKSFLGSSKTKTHNFPTANTPPYFSLNTLYMKKMIIAILFTMSNMKHYIG